jgi:hypothetical protein
MQRESHPVLQGIDYKKADATNNVLFYSNLKMLVMQKTVFVSYHITFILLPLSIIMRYAFLNRVLTDDEEHILHLMVEDIKFRYGIKIILLKDE